MVRNPGPLFGVASYAIGVEAFDGQHELEGENDKRQQQGSMPAPGRASGGPQRRAEVLGQGGGVFRRHVPYRSERASGRTHPPRQGGTAARWLEVGESLVASPLEQAGDPDDQRHRQNRGGAVDLWGRGGIRRAAG